MIYVSLSIIHVMLRNRSCFYCTGDGKKKKKKPKIHLFKGALLVLLGQNVELETFISNSVFEPSGKMI